MAKKKVKPKKKRSEKYERKLAIAGTLDEVLRVSVPVAKPQAKKSAR